MSVEGEPGDGGRRRKGPRRVAGGRVARASARSFLREMLRRVSDPAHPLHFLVVERHRAEGGLTHEWRTTERTTRSGRVQRGRFQGGETGPIIQAGHQGAYASGTAQCFMLEDADLNQLSGQLIETLGAYSFKEAILIDGVPLDVASALQWERLGLLARGTVARAPRIPPPLPEGGGAATSDLGNGG